MPPLTEVRSAESVVQPHHDGARARDFDLHGLVGIRLLDARPEDHAVVARQLGPIEAPLAREPDITIRFVDRLETAGPLRLIGANESGFAGDAFVILRARHKTPARVQVDLDRVGGRCELVCERGLPAVPLLLAIINLTVLAKGGIALHASAFRYRDRGILVTGWSKCGKTETLLSFLEHGAEYVGDEWIYLGPDGRTMFGIPEPVRVWDWQLGQLPHYRRRLRGGERVKLRTLAAVSGLLGAAEAGRFGARHVRRLRGLVERQRYAFLRPAAAFAGGTSPRRSALDHVFFLANADGETSVEPVSPAWIADRMVFSMEEERQPLAAFYRQFRFAFPARENPLIEEATAVESDRIRTLLAGRPCHAVFHPYPPSIRRLFDTMAPLITA